MPGINFDRVAEIYDATRGGERRGNAFAGSIAPWIVGSCVVELGVGTGVIALGLRQHGIDPLGVDLSAGMLRAAHGRLGAKVALADVDELPFADGSVDSVLLVWVLQLVDDPVVTLREAARVLRPGGRVIALPSTAEYESDDELAGILAPLGALRAHRRPVADLRALVGPALDLVHDGFTDWDEFDQAPSEEIENIEGRRWSSLFDVDDATWTAVVEPVLTRLHALPDPDRPRTRRNRHPLLVWERR